MKINIFNSSENVFIGKIISILLLIFLIFIIINHIYLRNIFLNDAKDYLKDVANSISKDINVKDNDLDVIKYFQNTSHPYDIPLYILTKEGFVIERMNLIEGFLDTASFEYSRSFSKPATITTPGKITWRVFSYPIVRNNVEEGSILVAYYDPKQSAINDIDSEMLMNANKINSLITIKDNKLDVSRVLSREISYDIYFQITDKFNKVLVNEGAPPSYIDRSYVANYLSKNDKVENYVANNGKKYLLYIKTIGLKEPLGVVIVGESISEFESLINKQQKYILISSLILLILTVLIFIYLKKELSSIVIDKTEKSLRILSNPQYLNPKKIFFDELNNCIYLDDQKVKIEYASKQYDFCKILLQYPNKRWENDELQDKLGLTEEDVHGRTFYDLKEIINKKIYPVIGEKLIFYENKTYYINPDLVEKIVKK